MAIGDKVVFDMKRFMTGFHNSNAIAITCYSFAELKWAIDFIKKSAPRNLEWDFNTDDENLLRRWENADEWISLYCKTLSSAAHVDLCADSQCSGKLYESDYRFSDIEFSIPIQIDCDEVLNLLV